MTLYAHGVDLLRDPAADLANNRLWPSYQHDNDGDSPPPSMAVVDPARFARWLTADREAAIALFHWARDQITGIDHPLDGQPYQVVPWFEHGRRPPPEMASWWQLVSVTWDEGQVVIQCSRRPIRPTPWNPIDYRCWHIDSVDGDVMGVRPPTWPWDVP